MKATILFITPMVQDAELLAAALAEISLDVEHVRGVREAEARLRGGHYTAVLTEAQLRDGTWRDVLRLAQRSASNTQVVVTDPFADSRFWAEALNLGAFDVLAQPFDSREVKRIMESATSFAGSMAGAMAASYFG